MFKAKVTSKGQITIPAEVRKAMGLKAGGKVAFFAGANGEFFVRRAGSIKDLGGCLAGMSLPRTDGEMNRAIADYLTELDDRTKTGAKTVEDGEAA